MPGSSFGLLEPGQCFEVALAFQIVPQLAIALRRELGDRCIQPGSCRLKAFEVSLRVAIAELVVGDYAESLPQGITQL
jgi:hypothetical protein